MALTDKVDRLSEIVAALTERVARLSKDIETVDAAHSRTAQAVTELQKEVALLRQGVEKEIGDLRSWKDDLKKREEEWGRRAWSFGPNVVAAIISIVLSVIAARLTARRQ